MVKVLQVITELELGGAQFITLNFLRKFTSSDFQNYLVSSPKGLLVEEVNNLKHVDVLLTPFLKRRINPIFDILSFLKICIYIKKNNIDIVHTHSSKAGIIGRWAAKAGGASIIVHTYHGFGFNDQQRWFTRNFFVLIEKLTSHITDKLIFVSKRNLKKALKLNIGNSEKNILIYGGINKEKFLLKDYSCDKIRENLGVEEDQKLVGTIGPLKPQKSPFDFIKICNRVSAKFPKVKFFWIGDGYLRSKVKNMIDEYGLNNKIRLLGWRKDVPEIMQILDVVVLTSYWEGLPHSLLEAIFSNKPVIAYGIDGVQEIIKNGQNGFIISPGDIEDFSQKLLLLLKDVDLLKKVGHFCYNDFALEKEFGIDNMVEKIEQLYTREMSFNESI